MGHHGTHAAPGPSPAVLAPLRVAVLVGGASRRMGRPKEALLVGGVRLLDRTLDALGAAGRGDAVLLGGARSVGGPASVLPRLADAPGVEGPLAGLLAALRSDPASAWLVAACDLPLLTRDAVEWLLSQRAVGRCAVLPSVAGRPQPLLAVYEPGCLPLLEALVASGRPSPSRLAGHPAVCSPQPPPELAPAWSGANTPGELARLLDASG